MGDRCYVEITIHKDHVDRYSDNADYPPRERDRRPEIDDHGHPRFLMDEVNGGAYDDRVQAAKRGCVFMGYQGPCPGAYSACVFCALDGQLYEALVSDGDGRLVVGIDDNGDPFPDDVQNVKAYLEARKRVRKLLEEGEDHGLHPLLAAP